MLVQQPAMCLSAFQRLCLSPNVDPRQPAFFCQVAVSADGTVRLNTPAAPVPGGWRTLPGLLPCGALCGCSNPSSCFWLAPNGVRVTSLACIIVPDSAATTAANHDIAAAVIDGVIYVCGGALWWRGYPGATHMFDEVWRFDPAKKDSSDAWEIAAKTPTPIAFSGIAAFGSKLFMFGGCQSHNGVPNDRSTHRQARAPIIL